MLRFKLGRALFVMGAAWSAAAFGGANETSPPAETTGRVIQFLEDRVKRDPDDFPAQNRLADLYLQRLRETGGYEWLRRARAAARQSLTAVPAQQNPGGQAVMTRVEFESHHFSAARDCALELTKIEPGKSRSFALLGDAWLESGELEKAAQAYEQMQQRGHELPEIETRLARLALARGEIDAARSHFGKALEAARDSSLARPEMTMWCLVQLGQLAFNTGDWDTAEKNYRSALETLPDDPRALEHFAELRAAQEKYPEAISLYEKVLSRMPRPEFWQALGDVYAAMGKTAEATTWHGRARDAYLKDAREGNAHYFHHLAGFYSDTEENSAEALKWARQDMELRHSAAAHDTLAWALYRASEFKEAAQTAGTALASGTKDAHILFHAGMIFLADNDAVRGKEILAQAARVNPRHNSFHVHR